MLESFLIFPKYGRWGDDTSSLEGRSEPAYWHAMPMHPDQEIPPAPTCRLTCRWDVIVTPCSISQSWSPPIFKWRGLDVLRNALESAHHHRVAAAGRCCMRADQQTHRQTHRWSISVSVEAWAVLARIQYGHSKRSLCALSLSVCVRAAHINEGQGFHGDPCCGRDSCYKRCVPVWWMVISCRAPRGTQVMEEVAQVHLDTEQSRAGAGRNSYKPILQKIILKNGKGGKRV